MAAELPSFGLVYALLLLVPGFLTYKVGKRFGKVTAEVDRFDKSIYTVIGSGISFSIVLLVYADHTQNTVGALTERTYSVFELGTGYLAILGVSMILGVVLGIVIDKGIHRNEDIRSESTWELATKGKDQPAKVHAIMNNGTEIWGEIKVEDSEPHGQDLLLEYPTIVIRDSEGKEVRRESVGEFVFISESDLSHVFYDTDIDI